ncbi:hypothetical protein KKE45_03285 [Patescibacteria group bacterium]|nr:hypothetical protein [Patescibacteria group bacterium]
MKGKSEVAAGQQAQRIAARVGELKKMETLGCRVNRSELETIVETTIGDSKYRLETAGSKYSLLEVLGDVSTFLDSGNGERLNLFITAITREMPEGEKLLQFRLLLKHSADQDQRDEIELSIFGTDKDRMGLNESAYDQRKDKEREVLGKLYERWAKALEKPSSFGSIVVNEPTELN